MAAWSGRWPGRRPRRRSGTRARPRNRGRSRVRATVEIEVPPRSRTAVHGVDLVPSPRGLRLAAQLVAVVCGRFVPSAENLILPQIHPPYLGLSGYGPPNPDVTDDVVARAWRALATASAAPPAPVSTLPSRGPGIARPAQPRRAARQRVGVGHAPARRRRRPRSRRCSPCSTIAHRVLGAPSRRRCTVRRKSIGPTCAGPVHPQGDARR